MEHLILKHQRLSLPPTFWTVYVEILFDKFMILILETEYRTEAIEIFLFWSVSQICQFSQLLKLSATPKETTYSLMPLLHTLHYSITIGK